MKKLVFASLFFLALVVQAEDGSKGRLQDGRAFRTDEDGNQLVDYIAELEVTNQNLEQRVRGLEEDLATANSKARVGASSIAERDLVSGESKQATNHQRVEPKLVDIQPVAASCPSCACPAAPKCDAAIEERDHAWKVREQAAEKQRAELLDQNAKLQNQVAQLGGALGVANQKVATLQGSIMDRGNELAALQGELKNTLASLQTTRGELKAQLSKEPEVKIVEVVKAPPAVVAIESGVNRQEARASFSVARSLAVDSIRGKLRTDLNQLRGMIQLRDRRFAEYSSEKRAVQLTAARAVSSRGLSVDEIRTQLSAATGVYELSQLKRDIADISAKVQDDLVLIERMLKSR